MSTAHQRSHDGHTAIVIRSATLQDAAELAELFRRYQHETSRLTGVWPPPPREACERQMRDAIRRRHGTVLVAADGPRLLGFCVLRITRRVAGGQSSWRARLLAVLRGLVARRVRPRRSAAQDDDHIAFMDELYAAPEGRRRGIGLPLLRQAFAWGRAQGVTTMEGATWADNRVMLRLAEHFDIEIVRVLLRKRL